MGLANGDWPAIGEANSEHWTDDQENHVIEGLTRFEFTLGHIADEAHPGEDCDEDMECSRTSFSWSRCDLCNSSLGGSREDVTIWFQG
jgi:hypothetical protein